MQMQCQPNSVVTNEIIGNASSAVAGSKTIALPNNGNVADVIKIEDSNDEDDSAVDVSASNNHQNDNTGRNNTIIMVQTKTTGNVSRKNGRKSRESNAKRFECKECEYKTDQKHCFRRHAIVHIYAKPFKCKICAQKFTADTSLKRHLRRIH